MLPHTRTIARIAGPAALALSVTERMNMHIYASQSAPVVYLNGALLFVAGVAILQAHWRWRADASVLVTLAGWVITGVGLVRMVAPSSPQLADGLLANAVLLGLGLFGLALSVLGYASTTASTGRRRE